jgi:hypothetical protein
MSGTKFFEKFPTVDYNFGDNEAPVSFQNLSVFIDTFDQLREEHIYYQSYYIKSNQRPDQLSYEVYGTTDYYWTLFLNNEHLRTNGWPLADWEVYERSIEYYPNMALSTNGISIIQQFGGVSEAPLCSSDNFLVGSWVYAPETKLAAQIIRIDDNLATLWLDCTGYAPLGRGDALHVISAADASTYIADQLTANPTFEPQVIETTSIEKSYAGHDAIHHYEDSNKDWVFPSFSASAPYAFDWTSVSTMQSISYLQRLQDLNDEKRTISILRPETVLTVISEFNMLLKQRL